MTDESQNLILEDKIGPGFYEKIENLTHTAEVRPLRGQITQVVGMIVKATLPGAKVGELCKLKRPGIKECLMAEVLGFNEDSALLMPLGDSHGLSLATEVTPARTVHQIPVGWGLLGHVLDGLGNIADDSDRPFIPETYYPVNAEPPNALSRKLIKEPLSLGVRAIDGLLTCGEGQRMGIFAAAGGGKSTLLAQILRYTEAEVVVLALIGERGREVREFLDGVLTPEVRKRTIVVVSTSDRPALERIKSACVATTIAEYFRDQGKKVLLLMDSVTRLARAQRLLGLAMGEPPARRGFPPSVFTLLPKILERAGPAPKGSITALYTVLVEGDDMNEPIADEVRSILDGHIILSRKLASANHYPAISILESLSRVMNNVVDEQHIAAAGKFRELLAKYAESELLIKIGEYKPGSDSITDEAIKKIDALNKFLKQPLDEYASMGKTVDELQRLVSL